jgi:selenoprotein W-related protein
MLWAFKRQLEGVRLVPSDGGRFEISVDGEPIYSKLETGQFPDEDKIVAEITRRAGQRTAAKR